jgi:hypothetical protein
MKKLWLVVVAVVLALGACGDDDADSDDNPVIDTSPLTTEAP